MKGTSEAPGDSTWDVVVVGAGPAGSMAARELARQGTRVLLVDRSRFPRYKVCGGCLNGRALGILGAAGLADLPPLRSAVPLTDFQLASGGRCASVPLPGGCALSREVLDTALVEAARSAGARFVGGARAVLTSGTATGWTLLLRGSRGENHLQARAVLAADGLGQRLLRSMEPLRALPRPLAPIGAGAVLEQTPSAFPRGRIHMAVGATGYAGLVRVEGGRLNIAAALSPRAVRDRGGPGPTVRVILEEAGYPVPAGMSGARWRGTPPLDRRPARVSAHRLLVLGDAAGYVEPFTGEGMAWALATGRAAANLIGGALEDFGEETRRAWEKRHARITAIGHWRCRTVAAALRRPRLVGLLTSLLDRSPWLAAPLVEQLNRAPGLESETGP